ncbi:hypothetical protein DFQ14_101597 [Halopolyspora algeriensis]|uniref:Uncharacterized protein n=1 Tax=Halopolyspora algeriensis TaxID=1500506 RepID=A0A368W0P4_9ACTN|nr:hypothetical protein DFQ14_101597 [Halopolyspora algeriensis]TQM42485.1 hypothetical protein FHU43_4115 [Halopolyspora algeriensis]
MGGFGVWRRRVDSSADAGPVSLPADRRPDGHPANRSRSGLAFTAHVNVITATIERPVPSVLEKGVPWVRPRPLPRRHRIGEENVSALPRAWQANS